MNLKISQSLIKDFKRYVISAYDENTFKKPDGNHCGLLFKAKYIDKNVQTEPSAAMKEGIYFEYLATGALPRTGETPKPEITARGGLTVPYERVSKAAEFFKKIIEHYNIKIISTGDVIETDSLTGIIDIWAEWDGKPCIIDLKYSGLIDDKWSDMGWNTDTLPNKDYLMVQGVHYTMIVKESKDLEVPFYYWIFNSKDPTDMKIIKQNIDPDQYEQHRKDIEKTILGIEAELKRGFKALPDYRNCKDCPLFENCTERQEYPVPIVIDYTDNKPSYTY
jgi:hypothetical protein